MEACRPQVHIAVGGWDVSDAACTEKVFPTPRTRVVRCRWQESPIQAPIPFTSRRRLPPNASQPPFQTVAERARSDAMTWPPANPPLRLPGHRRHRPGPAAWRRRSPGRSEPPEVQNAQIRSLRLRYPRRSGSGSPSSLLCHCSAVCASARRRRSVQNITQVGLPISKGPFPFRRALSRRTSARLANPLRLTSTTPGLVNV